MDQFVLVYDSYQDPGYSSEGIILYNMTKRTFRRLELKKNGRRVKKGDWNREQIHMHSMASIKRVPSFTVIDMWRE